VADAHYTGSQRQRRLIGVHDSQRRDGQERHSSKSGMVDGMADAGCELGQRTAGRPAAENTDERIKGADDDKSCSSNGSRPSPTNGFWRDSDWLYCTDGKWRAVEPSTFPLVDGVPARVGRLRAYGNAIVPQIAQQIIEAYLDA